MIEIYSKFYFLIRPITGMLLSDVNRRFRDGSTSLAYTYDTSLKQPKIRVANHTRFLSQNSKTKKYISFSQKKQFKTTSLTKIRKESMKN